MGELIQFRAFAGAAKTRPALEEGHSARIVFFTGVRYQRDEAAEPQADAGAPPTGGLNGAGGGKRKRRG